MVCAICGKPIDNPVQELEDTVQLCSTCRIAARTDRSRELSSDMHLDPCWLDVSSSDVHSPGR
jgi:hypothetical protein